MRRQEVSLLGGQWAVRRGEATIFSRFSRLKMRDSKEVYPSWVIASWHPWTSFGFWLSFLRGSEEGRQRLGHSSLKEGGNNVAEWDSHPAHRLLCSVTAAPASWTQKPGILFLLFLLPDTSVGPSLVLVPQQCLQGSCHTAFCLEKEVVPATNVRFGSHSWILFSCSFLVIWTKLLRHRPLVSVESGMLIHKEAEKE